MSVFQECYIIGTGIEPKWFRLHLWCVLFKAQRAHQDTGRKVCDILMVSNHCGSLISVFYFFIRSLIIYWNKNSVPCQLQTSLIHWMCLPTNLANWCPGMAESDSADRGSQLRNCGRVYNRERARQSVNNRCNAPKLSKGYLLVSKHIIMYVYGFLY